MNRDVDIAVIGMACRYPDADSVEQFWQNLCNGVESISHHTDEALLAAGVPSDLLADPRYVRASGDVAGSDLFDAAFFGYTPREAAIVPPHSRLFLMCAHELLERMGYDTQRESNAIGVFAGSGSNSYQLLNLHPTYDASDWHGLYEMSALNNSEYMPTNVSYRLNLGGPSVSVQTACSTSLVAIHLACQSLLNGECDIALAGGATINSPLKVGYLYQEGMALSPNGECRAFDANSSGTVFSNGVGIVALKMLDQAIEDGDTIHAVVRGSAINNDGAEKISFTAPSPERQAQAIREAQALAEVEPETIGYIETHGTGTVLGDPIEIAGLTQAFETDRRQYCAIGSVKTNIGHTDTAAGVAGFIKTVLAVKHGVIPPSLNYNAPNPNIDFANSPFFVNAKLREWRTDGEPRRAGVSSFGIGGTNAHVVLQQATVEPVVEEAELPLHVLPLSAKNAPTLNKLTQNLAAYLEREGDALSLGDVAHTLQIGRTAHTHRRTVVCRNLRDAVVKLTDSAEKVLPTAAPTSAPPIVFLFSGGGTQYVNMARGIYEAEPTFRAVVDRCAEILQPTLKADLRDYLFPTARAEAEAAEKLRRTTYALPALFTVEYALAQQWLAWGVQPQSMVGHSLGEYVAACIAGVFSLADALALVALRGRLIDTLPEGAMMSVSLSEQAVLPRLGTDLSIAAINAPEMCVVSGGVAAIDALAEQLQTEGIEHRRLGIVAPGHSAAVEPILPAFTEFARTIQFSEPQIPFMSNPTGTWITAADATDPTYWARHLRQTVRFADGLGEVLQEPRLILLEAGPGRTLTTLAKLHLQKSADHITLRSLRHPREPHDDLEFLYNAAGDLWAHGGEVDWETLHAGRSRRRVVLPTYPFDLRRFWVEPTQAQKETHAPTGRSSVDEWLYLPLWKQAHPLPPAQTHPQKTWWLFVDEAGVGRGLAEQLRQAGDTVVTIANGDQFAQHGGDDFVIAGGNSADYAQLAQLAPRPTDLVHAWHVTTDRVQSQHPFNTLLYLTQMLDNAAWVDQLRFTLLTNDVYPVLGNECVQPFKALALGWINSLPWEYPNIESRHIDLAVDTAAATLARELRDGTERAVAYRYQRRWLQTYERTHSATDHANLLRERGVYLITGGLGGVGVAIATRLAQTVQARLVLLNRSSMPPRDAWDAETDAQMLEKIATVRQLEALGGEVLVVSADVTDRAQMSSVIGRVRGHFGRINGVIHAAATFGGGVLLRQTPETIAETLAAKVQGTLVLDALLPDLDFLSLTSSQSALIGVFGNADYAAANAFQDAFAHWRTRQGKFTQSVNWDRWEDIGGVVEYAAEYERLTGKKLTGMTGAEGAEAFVRALAQSDSPQVIVSIQPFDTQLRQQDAAPVWDDVLAEVQNGGADETRPILSTAYLAPRTELETKIAAVFTALLGVQPVGVHDDFFEMGGHSLLGTQLVSRLTETLEETLALRQLFETPTVAGLADSITSRQQIVSEWDTTDELFEEGIL